ncbi:MAG: adenylate/guanylate cyclase domain-containing protein [Zetaproteobacteria bacterium]|nr:MAG: adenylate/guanylate cyclase domain-containing protein [Zetaproteobacteria bacterium]
MTGIRHRPPPISSFLPAETVDMMMHYGGDLPRDFAVEEQMTVLFTDLRKFTQFSEEHDPHRIYETLNASISLQTRIVARHHGSVNKFLGDGILAIFAGEERTANACRCMVDMARELPQIKREDADYQSCGVGFGMQDGKVLYCLLGDEHRREFTVIGDVPNTAARLCGSANAFEGLMTEECVRRLPEALVADHVAFYREMRLRGKRRPVRVYRIRP